MQVTETAKYGDRDWGRRVFVFMFNASVYLLHVPLPPVGVTLIR